MGIVDRVMIELYCPYCGEKLPEKEFQTKDLGQDMNTYTLVSALVKCKRLRHSLWLFFNCRKCNKYGEIDISDYDFELNKKIERVLDEEKEKLEVVENEFKYKNIKKLKNG